MKFLLTLCLTHPACAQEIELPEPTGSYAVGTTTLEWTDLHRHYQYSSHDQDHRRLVVQIWYPAMPDSGAQRAPYAVHSRDYDNVVTNSQLLPRFAEGLSTCPLILICPGRGVNHFAYSTLAESLGSRGYVVAAVGMPGIGNVTFSDGYVAGPNSAYQPSRELMSGPYENVDEFFERPTEIGRRDLELALERIKQLNANDPNGRFTNKIDLTNIGLFGHSLGGRIAGALAADNRNVNAYVSMEGIAPRRVRFAGLLDMPVAMMCSSGTWPYAKENYQTLIDGRQETVFMIELRQFGHNSVTDLPFLVPDQFNYEIDPRQGLLTSIGIVTAYFDAYLKNAGSFTEAISGSDNVVITEHLKKE